MQLHTPGRMPSFAAIGNCSKAPESSGRTLPELLYCNHIIFCCRHHTHSKEELLLAQTVFLGQFLNTSISPLVANASLPPLRGRIAGVPVLRDILFQGQLGDLIPEWYRQVREVQMAPSWNVSFGFRTQALIASVRLCCLL